MVRFLAQSGGNFAALKYNNFLYGYRYIAYSKT